MTDREVMQQALEALEYTHKEKCDYMRRNNLGDPLREDAARLALPAITALRARLAEPEPVAWQKKYDQRNATREAIKKEQAEQACRATCFDELLEALRACESVLRNLGYANCADEAQRVIAKAGGNDE